MSEQRPDAWLDLLVRAVSGDEDALTDLLTEYGARVRPRIGPRIPSRLRSLLSDDDVMQQTYTDAFLGIRGFAGGHLRAFHAWLLTIARRNLLDAIKMLDADRRGGRHRHDGAVGTDESYVMLCERLAGDSSTPSRRVARDEANDLLREAVDRLPEAYRQVVTAYDIEGRPVETIAEEMGRSAGAVFMLRARAHRRLREALGRSSDFFSESA